MRSVYYNEEIRQLADQQSRFAKRDKKLEQSDRAELFMREVDPDRTYSIEYVVYRITGFRPTSQSIITIPGKKLLDDLRLFVEDLSDAADIPVEQVGQPVYSVEDLSKRFNVSTKTISRWRQQGLVSRRFTYEGNRKRVGFLHDSVEHFARAHADKISRGERFSQLTDADKEDIIHRARRLVAAGGCPSEVTRRIAKHMHRSVETIRYTIRQFAEKYPELAVFPTQSGPLNLEIKERVYSDFLSGKPVDLIAKRYCRTRSAIYRVINEMRAKAIMALPLEYIDSPEFRRKGAEKRIVDAEMPNSDIVARKTKTPAGLPRYLASLYETPLLTREQEAYLFRKYNYLKYRAVRLRDAINPGKALASQMDEIERLFQESVKVKNRIVQANLRLVVSIAKRHLASSDDFFQLISDGNMSLIRAAEKFDYTRGNKFSTYASWAIMKNFARTIPDEFRQRERFRPTSEDAFLSTEDSRANYMILEAEQQKREEQISRILRELDSREQEIIVRRFGLNHSQEPLTLKEVGEELGVTKERIRQIESRALGKLRAAAMKEKIDLGDLILDD